MNNVLTDFIIPVTTSHLNIEPTIRVTDSVEKRTIFTCNA